MSGVVGRAGVRAKTLQRRQRTFDFVFVFFSLDVSIDVSKRAREIRRTRHTLLHTHNEGCYVSL
jgi:hypothetical protein